MSMSQSRDISNKIWDKADDIPDLIFVVKEEKFKVHKKIISKSPILAEMLKQDMEEKDCENVRIENVDPSIFFEVLYFLYHKNVKDKKNLSFPLYSAAKRFELDDLKLICEEAIIQNLNIKNAMSFLILADSHKADSLKKKIIDYIVENGAKMLEVPEYRLIGHMESHLIHAVLLALSLKKP